MCSPKSLASRALKSQVTHSASLMDGVPHVNPLNLAQVVGTLTRDEARNLAKHLGVPRGQNKSDTYRNLQNALANGKAHIKTVVYISLPPTAEQLKVAPASKGRTLFVRKFRNYNTDKVIQPVPPVLVAAE
jgi:hypothetical protein